MPARGVLPDWLRAMPAKAHSDIHGRDIRTVKQCPPFIDAMAYGVMILLPCDVAVDRGAVFLGLGYSGAGDRGPSARAAELSCRRRNFPTRRSRQDGQAALKFNSFWTIELEPGWSLFATHPVNRDDLPFRLISGLVDADRFHDGGINFPAVWTQPDFSGVLPKGTPVAQCFAVPRARAAAGVRKFRRGAQAKPTRRPSPTCWRRPASTASAFAPGADAQPSSERRSAASSSHSRPCGADVSAIAMVPKLDGRKR